MDNLIVGLAAVAFAAAGAAAWFAWTQARQYVLVEAFELIEGEIGGPLRLTLTVSVCNRRRASVRPLSIEIRGLPKAEVRSLDDVAKHPKAAGETAPFPDLPVPPFETREAKFEIGFDWQAARDAAIAAGGALRWGAVVAFDDRRRYGKRWTQPLDLNFLAADLHRLTSAEAPVTDRRGPNRPFSGAAQHANRA